MDTKYTVAENYEAYVGLSVGDLKNFFGKIIPKYAIILGTSGPKKIIEMMDINKTADFQDFGFKKPAAIGHPGKVYLGYFDMNVPVVVLQGRIHYSEGNTMDMITLPVRALAEAGVEKFILTNASGSMTEEYKTGDIVIVKDHINELGDNPLRDRKDAYHGQFVAMTDVYNGEMIRQCKKHNPDYHFKKPGVYLAVQGPVFETPAEIKKYQQYADLVGMSTVPEVIALKHLGKKILVLSCVTNMAAGMGEDISHEDNLLKAAASDESFSKIIYNFVSLS